MNRIKELREAAGLSSDELGERVGTSGSQIRKLEKGERRLTTEWMGRIAEALLVSVQDLISNTGPISIESDLEAVQGLDPTIAAALESKGLRVYRVTGRALFLAGVTPGTTLTFDTSHGDALAAHLKPLDVVLVELNPHGGEPCLVLRQFVPPKLLITNFAGSNQAITLDDPTFSPRLIGVAVRA